MNVLSVIGCRLSKMCPKASSCYFVSFAKMSFKNNCPSPDGNSILLRQRFVSSVRFVALRKRYRGQLEKAPKN